MTVILMNKAEQNLTLLLLICRRRLISQRSSLETLEDIEENAPLRRYLPVGPLMFCAETSQQIETLCGNCLILPNCG